MVIELTDTEVGTLLHILEQTPVQGLDAMKLVVLLACKLQDLTEETEE
tara:strand:- start:48 stop:191 length:144 start_codon:yes stop_codon:yes gene_type:complete